MIWIAILLFVVAAVAAFIYVLNRKNDEVAPWASGVTIVVTLLALLCTGIASVAIVKSGHVGVPVLFGSVGDKPLKEGFHIVNPFMDVHQMSTRTENYWMSHIAHEGEQKNDDAVVVRSSNGLQMPVDVSVPYRLAEDEACWVYQNLGDNYVEKILRPALSTATRRAASKYTAEQLYSTKLDEFSQAIPPLLEEEITNILTKNYNTAPKRVVTFSQVLVGYIGIPDTVKGAIENKLKADQEQQAMEFQIMKEKKEAERKKIEAEGIQTFQEIVTKGIDDRLLRWKAIDATLTLAQSPNSKIIIIGAGRDGLPVLLGNNGEPNVLVEPQKK